MLDQNEVRPVCGKCSTDHKGDRRAWPTLERIRQKYAETSQLPDHVAAPVEDEFCWSEGWLTTATSFTNRIGTLEDVYQWKVREGATLYNKTYEFKGKSYVERPWISTYGKNPNNKPFDHNAGKITQLWFDSDQEDDYGWDRLKAEMERLQIRSMFAESKSRKAGRWHCMIQLAKAVIVPDADKDPAGFQVWSKTWKLKYGHLCAILGVVAGFRGVGGKCGFDLATDRLMNLIYPGHKRTPDDAPGRVEVVRGTKGLDIDALLDHFGFDASVLGTSKKAEAEKIRFHKSVQQSVASGNYESFGPMGRALQVAGFLTSQWKSDGIVCGCPFNASHTAKYLPATDVWWCDHSNSCGENRRRRNRHLVVKALGSAAQAAYEAATAEVTTAESPETPKADDPGAAGNVFRWLRDQLTRDDVKVDQHRLLGAMTATMLRLKINRDFVARSLSWYESSLEARERVNYSAWRINSKQPTAGAGWIRRELGYPAALALADAINRDTGLSLVEAARGLLGMQRIRGGNADFLEDLHKTLANDDKIQAAILTPKGCGIWGDNVDQFGKYIGTTTLVCETLGCGRCFFTRCMIETKLLQTGWELDGRKIEGWTTRGGPFYVHRLAGFSGFAQLDEVLREVSRNCREAKVRVLDWEGETPALTFVIDNKSDSDQASGSFRAYERRFSLSYTRTKLEDGLAAAQAAIRAKVNLHVRWQQLMAGRDGPKLLEFTRWIKGRHLVSRSRAALPWPSREVIRQQAVQHARENAEGDNWESFDPSAGGITYTAVHLETGYELDKQDHPHQLYDVMKKAARRPRLKEIENEPDDDWFAAHEAAWLSANASSHALACAP